MRGDDLIADVLHSRLPNVITRGLTSPPRVALALAEAPRSATVGDDRALLARAAEIAVPLPPMPIPTAALAPETPPEPARKTLRLSALDRVKRFFGFGGDNSGQ